MAANERSTRFAQLVGLELKGEFAKHGISQSKVADDLKHSRTSYSKWMNAKPSMPLEAFLNTCELIHVDPRQIMDAAYSRLLSEMGTSSSPSTESPQKEHHDAADEADEMLANADNGIDIDDWANRIRAEDALREAAQSVEPERDAKERR